jgi:hypothetical protein
MFEQGIPMLSEHQSPNAETPTSQGYQPNTEEKKTLKMVETLFEEAKKDRKQFDENWLEYYKYFRGKQWKQDRPSYRHSEVINFVFQTIQSQVPIMTDAKQRIEFVAQDPSDAEFAKILDDVADSDWTYGNWTYSLAEMLYDGHILGTGLGSLSYDPKARFGMGAITFESEDPFYAFPAPKARSTNTKCPHYFTAEPVDIKQLKKEYEKGKFVKPDLADLIQGNKHDLDQTRFKSPVDNRMVLEGSSPQELTGKNQALKLTLYILDDEEIEERVEEMDPVTGEPNVTFLQKLKYPKGRKICVAGGVVLSDEEMELEEKLIPKVRFVNYIDPRSFWGISEVEQLKGPQNIFNKIYSFVLDVLTITGNPIWVVDTDSGVDTENLYNRPGLIVEKQKGSEVRREEGTQLQPYVLQILDRVQNYINDVSGSQDVSRGARPDGITAASAIQSLQEAAQTRLRQKSKNLDATLQDFGHIYKSYVMEKYDAPRMFRVTQQEGAARYFKLHIEKAMSPDGSYQKLARVREFNQNPETGAFGESIDERVYEIRGDFDVKITTGSSLPFAKDAKFAKARQMFQDGVIDAEEYLKQAEYPNWQNVLQRMRDQVQAQMNAQAQAQPGQPGAAPALPPPPAT